MSGSWLVRRPRTDVPAWRLLCTPHAGAGAAALSSWFAAAPPDCEVVIARLPGRESRLLDPPVTSIDEAAAGLLASVGDLLDRPFTVFGYSMGALIAYELTCALQSGGRRLPNLLAVGGHEAPHLARRHPPIHALPDEQFVAALRALGGTPEEVLATPDLFALLAPTLRADLRLVETYDHTAHAPLTVPVVTYTGRKDETVDPDGVRAWSQVTAAPAAHRAFAGGHFFFTDPRCGLLEDLVSDHLARS